MPIWLWVVAGLVIAFIVMSLVWRYGARRANAPCPVWLSWTLELGDKPLGRGRALQQLALEPGMRVADVGCGPGILTVPIAKAVGPTGEVVALDLQPKMLERMRKRTQAAGLSNVREIQAGAGEGTLPKNHFDRALLSTVLGEIPDRERALREIHDALKPGGFLVVAEVIGDPHYQFRKKVTDMATRVGLKPGEFSGGLLSYTIRLYKPSLG